MNTFIDPKIPFYDRRCLGALTDSRFELIDGASESIRPEGTRKGSMNPDRGLIH